MSQAEKTATPQKNTTKSTIIFFISVNDFQSVKLTRKDTKYYGAVIPSSSFFKQSYLKNRIILIGFLLLCLSAHAQRDRLRVPDSVSLEEYPQWAERIVHHFENHGYPFATVHLQARNPQQGDMTPILLIDTGQYVVFDSIILQGDARLSRHLLYPYLGLRQGMPYNEQLMQSVDAKLQELPYASVIRECAVSFVGDKAYLYVYLTRRRTSMFDGYVGLVPVDERTGRVTVHGELNLALNNLFKIGESITLHWRSSERYSQYLNINVHFPFIHRSRFGINGAFELDKRDTSFLNLNYRIGIPYTFLNNSYIEPYFAYSGSTLLTSSQNRISMADTNQMDFRRTLYGIRIHYRHLDNLYNPRKGIDLSGDLSAGTRTLLFDSRIDPSYYQGLPERSTSYRLLGKVQGYVPIGKHFVITPTLQAGSLLAGPHFYNELPHISGIGGIRGFNENEICASTYLLYSIELRYLFGAKSFVNLFFDGGTYEQQLPDRYRKDSPFGFGAGIHIGVKAGTFYLEYALGRQLGNPISFKTGKIHLGIQVDF